jgi:DNA-binding transcriptional MerR regulator
MFDAPFVEEKPEYAGRPRVNGKSGPRQYELKHWLPSLPECIELWNASSAIQLDCVHTVRADVLDERIDKLLRPDIQFTAKNIMSNAGFAPYCEFDHPTLEMPKFLKFARQHGVTPDELDAILEKYPDQSANLSGLPRVEAWDTQYRIAEENRNRREKCAIDLLALVETRIRDNLSKANADPAMIRTKELQQKSIVDLRKIARQAGINEDSLDDCVAHTHAKEQFIRLILRQELETSS